jgi:hypothetical protein
MARGDQIYVIREFLNIQGVYEHHGIDCGDGTVIHYRKPSERIERTTMATLTQGSRVYVKQYTTCFIPDVVVHRAESRVGERRYNLLFNNCEHFANWCKTGVSDSLQVRNFIPVLSDINVKTLIDPVQQSLTEAERDDTPQLVNQALAEIKVAWENIQPQYKEARQEMNVWHRVAMEAVKRNREDLARAAIKRKLSYKQRVDENKEMLDKLATMTESLLRNYQDQQELF